MTAPQPATRGTETCPNGCNLDYYGTHQGPPDCDRLPRDPNWNNPNPAGPMERLAAPSPVDTTEPPAETQDFHPVGSRPCCAFPAEALRDDDHEPYADAYEWEPVAARPSADTETLADRFISGALDNIGAFDGSNDEARDRADVRAAHRPLGWVPVTAVDRTDNGQDEHARWVTLPGDDRQHTSDGNCPCGPVQADNGAWDHQ